jgi:CHAT domain
VTRTTDQSNRVRDLWNLSVLYRRRGDDAAATDLLERSAAVAMGYLASSDNEWLVVKREEEVNHIIAELAWMYARAGDPIRALAATEAVRGLAVRLYTMPGSERLQWDHRSLATLGPRPVVRVEDGESRLYLTREPEPLSEELELPDISVQLEQLRTRLADEATAIVSVAGTPGRGLTAVICYPDGTLRSVQWELDPSVPVPVDSFDAPGIFREGRFRNLSEVFYEQFFGPVDRALRNRGVSRIALSTPFWLGRFPLEALRNGSPYIADDYQIIYMPSIMVAADLPQVRARPDHTRMLIVGYTGSDLPHSHAEVSGLKGIWRDRATVVSADECTKTGILAELAGDYDIIHFCCHASYDPQYPLKSALHLVPEPQDDRHRVAAWEIMKLVRFAHAPVVSLSACSSGVMDGRDTNPCYGLTGSFLRAGARLIIGTRWPVYDDTAEQAVLAMYRTYHNSGQSVPRSLHAAEATMRGSSGIEDWAAFGCVGLP